ncbi:muramidase (flagellum-specific) (plasmid) [Thermobacillus composti KWC4]|jgi:hypothetical protein|uniref:Muramidase (Flagellum-specific) n=1 Tax=Thermobacillus composti (strain DSM 18247 / JCM 13945 / KWC4) TaxID=717605 RepID=L0EL40_THECK|nr:glucosaminidase domain-containing protein [Thermobacillus composti]AGA60005.1 muramidase (flagellum-specific) [Thermobacillus composti KWC4]
MNSTLEQAKEFLKGYGKQRLLNELKKRALKKVQTAILTNPWFWIVLGILFAVFLFFYLIAAAVASSQQTLTEYIISDKILSPQIYKKDLENAITSPFGERSDPFTGQTDFHPGIDISLPEGTPVASSFDGVVQTVSYPKASDGQSTKNAGIFVVVASTDDTEVNMTARYLHLKDAFVTPGQTVKKGEIIGLSGNTGRSTGPHLHFELKPKDADQPIDPSRFIFLMSKLTDAATTEAFRAMKKISWTVPNGYDYHSDKMLYVSDVYMGIEPPKFNTSGGGNIRSLYLGGSSVVSHFGPNIADPAPAPADDDVVTIPDTGELTHPFFIQYAAAAQAEERRSGIPASITLAQAALESAYGQSAICNNFFGIKADASYNGPTCTAQTREEYGGEVVTIEAKFRKYDNAEESFADHSDFLLKNSRYRRALSKTNPYEFANELQRAGYATDSQYANKLKAIIRSQNLTILDANRGIDPTTGQPFQDVPFNGSGEVTDAVTFVFGIQQFYGNYAKEVHRFTDSNGNVYVSYSNLTDPLTGNRIINLVNFNNVVNYYYGRETMSPELYVKDLPAAISVTIQSGGDDEFFVSRVEYVKGTY